VLLLRVAGSAEVVVTSVVVVTALSSAFAVILFVSRVAVARVAAASVVI
jgi:hypothetical protein